MDLSSSFASILNISKNPVVLFGYCDSLCEPQNGILGSGPMDVGYWAKTETGDVLFATHELIRDVNGHVITGTCNQAEYYGLLRLHERLVQWLRAMLGPMEGFVALKTTDLEGDDRDNAAKIAASDWRRWAAFREQVLTRGIQINLHSDSQLMVHQLDGEPYRTNKEKPWKVKKEELRMLFAKAVSLHKLLPYTLYKLDREQNGLADSLAQNRVLKGSSQAIQLKEKFYLVRKHTPCAEFIRGDNAHSLLRSQIPTIKNELLALLQSQSDDLPKILQLLNALKEEAECLKARVPHVNDQVNTWLSNTFQTLFAEVEEWTLIAQEERFEELREDIIGYFEILSRPISATHEIPKDDANKLSQVTDEFLLPRKQNQGKKNRFGVVEEVDGFEDKREDVYLANGFFQEPEDEMEENMAAVFGDEHDWSAFNFDGVYEDRS